MIKCGLKQAAALVVLLAACWGTIVGVDYHLCTQGKEPVFAVIDRDVMCMGCYRGLGYTIGLSYDGERPCGTFYWGREYI